MFILQLGFAYIQGVIPGLSCKYNTYLNKWHPSRTSAIILAVQKSFIPLHRNGAWAGRLGTGLQNQLERFNSARHLQNRRDCSRSLVFVLEVPPADPVDARSNASVRLANTYVNHVRRNRQLNFAKSLRMSYFRCFAEIHCKLCRRDSSVADKGLSVREMLKNGQRKWPTDFHILAGLQALSCHGYYAVTGRLGSRERKSVSGGRRNRWGRSSRLWRGRLRPLSERASGRCLFPHRRDRRRCG